MENQPSQSGVDESALDEQQQQQQNQDETNQQQASSAIMIPVPAMSLPHPEFMIPHSQIELGQSLVYHLDPSTGLGSLGHDSQMQLSCSSFVLFKCLKNITSNNENVLQQVRAAYHYPDPYYGGMVAAYGPQTVVHPHILGVPHTGVPLPSDAIEEPVYVNAKQYHGILRRRQSRAKAESENKLIKSRKPYLHESRHLHAIKRARGCGGRFLNSKSNNEEEISQENNSNGNIGQEPGLDKSDSGKKAKVSTQH